MQGAIFTDRVAQEQVEHSARSMAERAVAMNYGCGARLQILADALVGFLQQGLFLSGLDLLHMLLQRQRLPIQKIPAAGDAVQGDLIGAQNETGKSISRIADPSEIAPGTSGVTGMDADAIPVDAAERFARHLVARRPSMVPQNELVSGQRDGLADLPGSKAFGERIRSGLGSVFGRGFEDGLAQLLHPVIVADSSADGSVQQMMVLEHFGQERARLIAFLVSRPGLSLDAIANGLTQESVGVLFTDEIEQIPGAIGKDHAMDFGVILHSLQQTIEGFFGTKRGHARKGTLGLGHILMMDGAPERFGRRQRTWSFRGTDRTKDFFLASTLFLDAVGIAVKHFENRQRLKGFGKLAGHVERRRQRHHRMETDVILPTESAGVGQRRSRDEAAQLHTRFEFVGQRRQQFFDGGLLHEADERFERAKIKRTGDLSGKCAGEAQFRGKALANADH